MSEDPWRHCEEWCEGPLEGPHGDVCPERQMDDYTKGEFVRQAVLSARYAIEAYRSLLSEDGMDDESAREMAEANVEESAVCYAGIGSCGRGWCNHS
jgi:hypothetical protein